MKDKKGFTLVELLAVIVVLGIIMAIAAGTITRTISNARKNSFINSHKMLTKEIKTRIQKNKLGIDIEPVECDESNPNPDNKCSKVYDISDKDYKMVVKKSGFGNYLFTLEGVGKFADVDLTDEIDNAHTGILDTKNLSNNSNSAVTSFFSLSGETVKISEDEKLQEKLNLGRKINFLINDIIEKFGTDYQISASNNSFNQLNGVRYNVYPIADDGTGPIIRQGAKPPSNIGTYEGDNYFITIKTQNSDVSSISSDFFSTGSGNAKLMNGLLKEYDLIVPGVCYYPNVEVNSYFQMFILNINGSDKEVIPITWSWCNNAGGYVNYK